MEGHPTALPGQGGLPAGLSPQTPPGPPGGTHMSLAGRFLPSTMRMESALRRAMAGGQRSGAEGAERSLEPAAPSPAPMCGPAPPAANQRAGRDEGRDRKPFPGGDWVIVACRRQRGWSLGGRGRGSGGWGRGSGGWGRGRCGGAPERGGVPGWGTGTPRGGGDGDTPRCRGCRGCSAQHPPCVGN